MKEVFYFGKYLTILIIGIILIAVYKTFDNLGIIWEQLWNFIRLLTPFLIGFGIAYFLSTPTNKLESFFKKFKKLTFLKNHARGISVATVYVSALIIISVTIRSFLPMISQSISEFISYIPTYYENALRYLQELPQDSWIKELEFEKILEDFSLSNVTSYFNFDSITSYVQSIFGIVSGAISAIICIIVSIYTLLYISNIKAFIKRLIKVIWGKKAEKNVVLYIRKSNNIFLAFIYSQFIDAIIIGLLTTLLLLILKVEYAGMLGFLIGLFNVIPYFGAIIASVFAVLVTILTGGFYKALLVAVCLLILQQIDANVIGPRIIGNSLNLNPILTILALIIGGAYFGMLGMFLAIPIVAFFKLILEEYMDYKETKIVPKINN